MVPDFWHIVVRQTAGAEVNTVLTSVNKEEEVGGNYFCHGESVAKERSAQGEGENQNGSSWSRILPFTARNAFLEARTTALNTPGRGEHARLAGTAVSLEIGEIELIQ